MTPEQSDAFMLALQQMVQQTVGQVAQALSQTMQHTTQQVSQNLRTESFSATRVRSTAKL
eukprot:5704652-Amphidinium_carterae.1